MNFNFWLGRLVIILLIVCSANASDMYSSIAELERLYLKEQQVNQRLEEYLNIIKKQTTIVDQYSTFVALFNLFSVEV